MQSIHRKQLINRAVHVIVEIFQPLIRYVTLQSLRGNTKVLVSMRAARGEGGGGGGLPCPFLKIKKSALILEKNTLIVSLLRLNLPFKMQPQTSKMESFETIVNGF